MIVFTSYRQIMDIDEVDNLNFNKTSPEPEMFLDMEKQMSTDAKYLSYVDQIHSRINSKSFNGAEPLENDSESELYSEHRLRSTSSEKESTVRLEETRGKLYVVKKIDDENVVKIPHLDLGNIIEKQKRKMYPFNINTQGELIELTNKASSIDTHNDEDAIIIYDEQDREEDDDLGEFRLEDNLEKKHSNLFNSSFFSDLSSVHKSKFKNENKIKAEEDFEDYRKGDKHNDNAMIMIDDKFDHSNHHSFLDQELNIESIHHEGETYNISFIQKETNKSDKNILEAALNYLDGDVHDFEKEPENSPFSGIQKIKDVKKQPARQNNFLRSDSDDSMGSLNKFLNNDSRLQSIPHSRDQHSNKLGENDVKARSVPAKERKIDEDHVTFGKDGCDITDQDDQEMHAFGQMLMNQGYDGHFDEPEDDPKIRNKSVVIPRSSILLKNKKNIQKRNAEASKIREHKNYSVSPSKIMFASKKTDEQNENCPSYQNLPKNMSNERLPTLKNFGRTKINLKSNKILKKDDSNHSIHDSIQMSQVKFIRNKIVPFKFIKNKKNAATNQSDNYGSKSKLQIFYLLVENFRKSVPRDKKHVINIQKVKVIKSDAKQEAKPKTKKLNLRFKDFSQKKTMIDSSMITKVPQSESKTNKSCFLQVKTNCDYNNISDVNMANYSTNN